MHALQRCTARLIPQSWLLRARSLCCLRRETAFSPESAAGSSNAGTNGPFCASSRKGADRRWGFGASLL